MLKLPQVYYKEVSKIWNKARNVQTYAETAGANAVMMWAVVWAHDKHWEFKAHWFQEHPQINPKVLLHFFQRCACKTDLDDISASQRSLLSSVSSVELSITKLHIAVDRVQSKVANFHHLDPGAPAANPHRNCLQGICHPPTPVPDS